MLSLELYLDDMKVSDFGGQKVTVKVNYDLAEGEDASTLAVWYLDDENLTMEKVESSYVDGVLSVTMDHFSYWVIGHDIIDDEDDDGFPVAVVVVLAVVAILCLALLRFKR